MSERTYRVTHLTRYEYSQAVDYGHNEARLHPRDEGRQRCLEAELQILPEPARLHHRRAGFGNQIAYFAVEQRHHALEVRAESTLTTRPPAGIDPERSPPWEEVARSLAATGTGRVGSTDQLLASTLRLSSPFAGTGREFASYAAPSFTPGRPLLQAALELMARVHRDFTYNPTATNIATPLRRVMRERHGVCQDFAHLMLACLRSLGLGARYVSGYLETLPPPGQPKLRGADASHAWLAVFCPAHGWVDLDPTNDQVPQTRHLTLGWGRDYGDVMPLNGVIFGGGRTTLSVAVDVQPLPAVPPMPPMRA